MPRATKPPPSPTRPRKRSANRAQAEKKSKLSERAAAKTAALFAARRTRGNAQQCMASRGPHIIAPVVRRKLSKASASKSLATRCCAEARDYFSFAAHPRAASMFMAGKTQPSGRGAESIVPRRSSSDARCSGSNSRGRALHQHHWRAEFLSAIREFFARLKRAVPRAPRVVAPRRSSLQSTRSPSGNRRWTPILRD